MYFVDYGRSNVGFCFLLLGLPLAFSMSRLHPSIDPILSGVVHADDDSGGDKPCGCGRELHVGRGRAVGLNSISASRGPNTSEHLPSCGLKGRRPEIYEAQTVARQTAAGELVGIGLGERVTQSVYCVRNMSRRGNLNYPFIKAGSRALLSMRQH